MAKPPGRSRPASPAQIAGRNEAANQFLADAALAESSRAKVTLLVLAGIAASDAICAKALGEYSVGENHDEAVSMLARVSPEAATDLRSLLSIKTRAGYGEAAPVPDQVRRAERAATRLVTLAERTVAT